MSTKKIGEALERFRVTAPSGYGDDALWVASMAELEDIRKVAKEWVAVDGLPGPGRMQRIDTLLRSIAKEEP